MPMVIEASKYTLDNGLRVLVHTDSSTPLAAVNLLYDVGSKDEHPEMTGFAHLFEHLMFGGTGAIPNFDKPLQLAGGENNAFTNTDITNYYITIPVSNIETALWLESDRMKGPDLSDKSLMVQKKVVAEEFRQRYLNQPYGDVMLNLRPYVYKVHPYRWPTIGIDISHIEKADHNQLRDFFTRHYHPGNAILTISGNISPEKAARLVTKWFGKIEPGATDVVRDLPREPVKTEPGVLSLERDVPADAIYKAWVINKRSDPAFHIFDALTDILAGGESGRLYASLVREKRLFSGINAFVTGELDRGMLIIFGRVSEDVAIETAEEALNEEIDKLRKRPPSDRELQKVKNRFESSFHLSHAGILHKATALSIFELMGDAMKLNEEVSAYSAITAQMISESAERILSEKSVSTLFYRKLRKE
ncbi:MAG: pitrilysin family protein [Bacteroidales bacterium]